MAKAVISELKNKVSKITLKRYPISKISESKPTATINHTLPFRIKITNIGIPGYSSSNPAPIGIAIIGFNNYIL